MSVRLPEEVRVYCFPIFADVRVGEGRGNFKWHSTAGTDP